MTALLRPAFEAGIALTRLDERISRSPIGAEHQPAKHRKLEVFQVGLVEDEVSQFAPKALSGRLVEALMPPGGIGEIERKPSQFRR